MPGIRKSAHSRVNPTVGTQAPPSPRTYPGRTLVPSRWPPSSLASYQEANPASVAPHALDNLRSKFKAVFRKKPAELAEATATKPEDKPAAEGTAPAASTATETAPAAAPAAAPAGSCRPYLQLAWVRAT